MNKAKIKNTTKNDPEIVKFIFKLFDGRIIEIQTTQPFMVSVIDEIELKESDEVFRIVE